MKRLLLLFAITAFITSSALSQAPRRVLVEEMVSTTCYPCAAVDPSLEKFEHKYFDNVCVLKWHVNWPIPGTDPFYAAYPAGRARATDYYSYPGVPNVLVNGLKRIDVRDGIAPLEAAVEGATAVASPYRMELTQSIEGDNMIVEVTVSCVSTPPSASDLRLGVAVAERFVQYTGVNGRRAHSNVVRTMIPGLTSNGAVTTSDHHPGFALNAGETSRYRFVAPIQPNWDRNQLIAVAFIQSAGTKEVFQSNWTVPPVLVDVTSNEIDALPFDQVAEVNVTNISSAPVTMNISLNLLDKPSEWGCEIEGIEGKTITLAGNEQRILRVQLRAPEGATGTVTGVVAVSSSDGRSIGGHMIDWKNSTATVKTGNVADALSISAYPNPLSNASKFLYSVTAPGMIRISIFDPMGREVSRVINNELHTTGTYEVDFDAAKLSNGTYTFVLSSGSQTATGSMAVQK